MNSALFTETLPYLLHGLVYTALLASAVLVVGSVAGVGVGLLRFTPWRPVRFCVGWTVEILRAIPLLLQLFFIFFGLPSIGIEIPTFPAAVLAMSLWMAANTAEVVRGGMQSIPNSQAEAARSTGLSGLQTVRYIIFPQAVRRMLPAYIGLCTILIKDTSLTSIIGMFELTRAAQETIARTYQSLETYLLAAALYFCLCYPLSLIAQRAEAKLNHD